MCNGFHHINGFTEDLGENVEVDCSPDYKKDAQFTLEKQPNLSDLSSDVQNSSDRLNYEIDSLQQSSKIQSTSSYVDESPINEPFRIIQHKAQVLPQPVPCATSESSLINGIDCNNDDSSLSEDDDKIKERSSTQIIRRDSQDILVNVECPAPTLVVTNKLPEVLIVAEKLPEQLPVAENLLSRHSSRSSTKELLAHQDEPSSNLDEEDFVDDGGSTLTIGRGSTLSKQSDVHEIIQIETENEEHSLKENDAKYKSDDIQESCISPFFHMIYIFLGCLIIFLLGLNFWFGFHLLFLIALFSAIALLVLVLTEFNEYQNLSA